MQAPEVLGGRYELRGVLGRGGMAEVRDGWDIRLDRPVAGYCATWFLLPEVHINNLAVRPELRRRGFATYLLGRVLQTALEAGGERATLEVRRSNHAARRLYEGLGFRVRGVRADYYTDPVEDALILWREPLAGSARAPDPA